MFLGSFRISYGMFFGFILLVIRGFLFEIVEFGVGFFYVIFVNFVGGL